MAPRRDPRRLLSASVSAVLIAGLAALVCRRRDARAGGATPSASASPARPAARCSRPTTRGTSASTRCRRPRARRRSIARIGLGDPVHPDFGSGLYNGAPIGIPYAVVSKHTRRVPVSFQYASESDGHRYPLPAQRPDRGRAALDRRPPRDRRRPRHVHRLRAVRRLPAQRRRALDGGLGRDLQPALRPPAPGRVDVGRRRRAADPARPGASTTRSPAARSTTRCASPRRARPRGTSTRPATRRPPAAARRCRRWGCACA